jgi:phenylalanyl-tRNA synthetase alpha chain
VCYMIELEHYLIGFSQSYFLALHEVKDELVLEQVRVKFLGRNGLLTVLMKKLKELSVDERRLWAPRCNDLKHQALTAFEDKKQFLFEQKIEHENERLQNFDVTAYKPDQYRGSLHPLTSLIQRLEDILSSMGFDIRQGPELEVPFFNFEALNIPEDHPARDIQDTFWLKHEPYLLRTHTSNVQIREMHQKKPPLAIASLGRVFRSEATDATHDFVFHQCEGFMVDTDISMAHLLAVTKSILTALFVKHDMNIRIRPSYYPFVEPGIDVDISCLFCTSGCSVCKKTGWIELAGAGLIHPSVLRSCSINPDHYRGFAFGFGIERLAMLMYGINDIRLFRSNKIDFLKQF